MTHPATKPTTTITRTDRSLSRVTKAIRCGTKLTWPAIRKEATYINSDPKLLTQVPWIFIPAKQMAIAIAKFLIGSIMQFFVRTAKSKRVRP